jgi:hypothetical protein
MNESNKSFYPSDMFEFIHHPKYGCHDLKGLMNTVLPRERGKEDVLLDLAIDDKILLFLSTQACMETMDLYFGVVSIFIFNMLKGYQVMAANHGKVEQSRSITLSKICILKRHNNLNFFG